MFMPAQGDTTGILIIVDFCVYFKFFIIEPKIMEMVEMTRSNWI